MNTDQEMRRKMAEIGARYLARTVTEIEDLKRFVSQLAQGTTTALKDIEVLSHRIRGSGAVFGFAKLSDTAGVIEMLAVDSALDGYDAKELAAQFSVHLQHLTEAMHAAVAAQKN